jgi:hypothetical protein
MAKFLKFSNGPVRFLVDSDDKNRIEELLASGFNVTRDKAGKPVVVDSKKVTVSDNPEVDKILNELV